MIDLFGIYFNTYLVDIFDKASSQYENKMADLDAELKENLNPISLNLLEQYSFSIKSHIEDIALKEIEKAFYRGLYFFKNFKDFIDNDID